MFIVRLFVSVIRLAALVAALCSLASLAPAEFYIPDILSNFHLQYLCVLPVLMLFGGVWDRKYFFFLCLLAVAVSGFQIYEVAGKGLIDEVTSQNANALNSRNPDTSIRVLSVNVLSHNGDVEGIKTLIRRSNPDVVVFLEFTNFWSESFREFLVEYPSNYLYPAEDNFGIAVMSKIPFGVVKEKFLVEGGPPTILATLMHESGNIGLIATHPFPPTSEERFKVRNQQLLQLALYARKTMGKVILAGDLNITPYSSLYKQFIKESLLSDPRQKFGLALSWPDQAPKPLQIPIDYILVGDKLEIADFYSDEAPGSDHLAVVADVVVK